VDNQLQVIERLTLVLIAYVKEEYSFWAGMIIQKLNLIQSQLKKLKV